MLTKNSVEIVDYKGEEFDKLDNYVRPIPNKKFMGIFPIKTAIYGRFQPKELRDGTTKDTKFNQWMRKKGEAPVLYDTNNVAEIRNINLRLVGQQIDRIFDRHCEEEISSS